jgi:two-component system, response regulator / RNA-binding antiterminator
MTPWLMALTILLADAVPERAAAVEASLVRAGIADVHRAPPGANLADLVAILSPDVVIVDMALPDRDALDSLRAVTQRTPRPIVMFVDRDDPSFMEEAIEAGVSSYNVGGLPLPDVKPIVAAAIAMFRRYRRVERELAEAKLWLDERRDIKRAKAILMAERSLDEPSAYAWLRRKAMNENRRIAEIAAELIDKNAPPSLRRSGDAK